MPASKPLQVPARRAGQIAGQAGWQSGLRTPLGRVAVLRGGNSSYNISRMYEAFTTVTGGLKDLPLYDTTQELSQQIYIIVVAN